MSNGATNGARASRTAPAIKRCDLGFAGGILPQAPQGQATQCALQHQGEWWTVDDDGQRYQRWWGEDHFGNGWVRKHGHSTTDEQWDVSEQMDTYYKCGPEAVTPSRPRCRLASLSAFEQALPACARKPSGP